MKLDIDSLVNGISKSVINFTKDRNKCSFAELSHATDIMMDKLSRKIEHYHNNKKNSIEVENDIITIYEYANALAYINNIKLSKYFNIDLK